jgi:hypothetical protein
MQELYEAIKGLLDGRVYALVAPEGTACPFMVYTPVATEHVFGVAGPCGIQRVRTQLDAYAKSLAQAFELHDQVLVALMDAMDTLVDVRMGVTEFDDEAQLYRVSFDYSHHQLGTAVAP